MQTEAIRDYFIRLGVKITNLFQSRKFWVLVTALVVVAQSHAMREIGDWQAIQAIVAALSAYSLSVGIEDAGIKQPIVSIETEK